MHLLDGARSNMKCIPFVHEMSASIAAEYFNETAKNEKAWATASDVGVAGLSLAALGLPIAQGDKQGAFQAAGSLGAAALITTGLKYTFPELRPDGSDRKSFPSGHTSTAFAAAASLYNRQGAGIGPFLFLPYFGTRLKAA